MEDMKWNVVNATCGVPMAQKSVMPIVIQNFSHGIFCHCCEDEQNFELVELQGHIDCPSTFVKFLNVANSFPATGDQLTSLGSPNPGFVHVIDEEGKTEDTWPLPVQPSCKDALMVLLVLGALVRTVDATDRTTKAMNKLQDFVSTVYKGV